MPALPPLPLTLYPSRVRLGLYAAAAAVFVALGAWMWGEGERAGLYVAGFFGLCLAVFLAMLWPGAAWLRLDAEGFTTRWLFRTSTVRWADVGPVRPTVVGRQRTVGWDAAPHVSTLPATRGLARDLTGVEGALPDPFGLRPEALAALMNAVRAQHLRHRPGPPPL